MNIELKPIAESKVRQLGGDVCGVLVRREDSEVMAVSEHGRCTRLDAGVMGPVVVAYDPEVCTHGDADDDAACEECIEKWTRQAASVQSGQEVEQDWSASKTLESEGWKNPLLSKNDRLQIADGAVAWRECLAEMVQAMHDYEMSVDEGAPYKHRAMMDRAHALLSATPQPGSVPEGWGYVVEVFLENVEEVTELLLSGGAADNIVALCNDLNKAATVAEKVLSTPQPEGDGWIECSERLPTEADADSEGNVWFCWPDGDMRLVHYKKIQLPYHSEHHWKPTGLKRPQPPAGQGDDQ